MSQEQIYTLSSQLAQVFESLGYWQSLGLAMYSLGMIAARHCAPSRVSEKLGAIGKPTTIQRRLERFIDNRRIVIEVCCQTWARAVLRWYDGQQIILLVDETKLGRYLSVMMVGLAYRQCCIPLAWWCYRPDHWPMKQVALIQTLLSWIVPAVPPGCTPLVQADRGIGCSPGLVRVVQSMGWRFLFRVQRSTRFRTRSGRILRLDALVKRGETWCGTGAVFKKAGWIAVTAHLIWRAEYEEPWCLITNDPLLSGDLYAMRYWQEAGFRDLKSDGWQWQASHIFTPDHADRLLLVMALAYALTLTAGTLALADPETYPVLKKSRSRIPFSLFRLGLRLFDYLTTSHLSALYSRLLSAPPWGTLPAPVSLPPKVSEREPPVERGKARTAVRAGGEVRTPSRGLTSTPRSAAA